MSKSIFIVVGTCGEYSDRSDWNVCWYPTKAQADAFAAKCTAADADLGVSDRYDSESETVAASMIKRLDPSWSTDYTGTRYYVCEVRGGK